MRVAVILVLTLMVPTSSHASSSCMTKSEARQQFATTHLYWHGPNHCWDATPGRHHQVYRVQQNNQRETQPDNDPPKWREAMSEMLPGEQPIQSLVQQPVQSLASTAAPDDARTPAPYDALGAAVVSANWLDRWVDIVQVFPPTASQGDVEDSAVPPVGRNSEPKATASALVLIGLALVLTLAIMEFLFRGTAFERRK